MRTAKVVLRITARISEKLTRYSPMWRDYDGRLRPIIKFEDNHDGTLTISATEPLTVREFAHWYASYEQPVWATRSEFDTQNGKWLPEVWVHESLPPMSRIDMIGLGVMIAEGDQPMPSMWPGWYENYGPSASNLARPHAIYTEPNPEIVAMLESDDYQRSLELHNIINDAMSVLEVAESYNLTPAAVRAAAREGRVRAKKSGATWLISQRSARKYWG